MAISTNSTASSGLQSLVTSLMANDRKPLEALQAKKAELQERSTAFSSLSSSLSSLLQRVRTLERSGSANALRKLTSSGWDDTQVGVTVDGRALSGAHTIEVVRLASTHTLASRSVAAGEDAGGGDAGGKAPTAAAVARFRIAAGDTATEYEVSLDPALGRDDAVRAIADAINEESGPVQASVVNQGKGRVALLLRSSVSGEDGRVTAIEDLDGSWMRQLGLAGTPDKDGRLSATLEEPADALVTVDGVEATASSNTMTDLLPGVTLSLRQAGGGALALNVERDSDAIVEEIQAFITEYNKTLEEVRARTQSADSDGVGRGLFAGDASVSRLRSSLRSALIAPAGASGDGVRILADLGITSDREGRLSISSEKTLRDALQEDSSRVEALFNGTDGVAGRLARVLDEYSRVDGILNRSSKAARTQIRLVEDRITSTTASLARREQLLLDQLAQMQSAVSSLQQQQQYLSGLLSSGDSLYL